MIIKNVEKAEVLNPFVGSVFNNKTDWPQDKCSPELVDGNKEHNRCL